MNLRSFIQLILIYFCCTLLSETSIAQEIRITGEFHNTPFADFIGKVEASNKIHFYYEASDVDSIKVSETFNDIPVTECLKLIFQNTIFQFSIDGSKNIFITKNKRIQTTLPDDFFVPSTDKNTIDIDSTNATLKKGKIKTAFTENKLYQFGTKSSAKKGNIVLSGYVRDNKNGEALQGASVYIDALRSGVLTDPFGYYSLTIPQGSHTLEISSLGMKVTKRHLLAYSDGNLNIDLEDDVPSLKTVIIYSEKHSNVKSTQMGIERLSIKSIKLVPVIFGEADILKVVLTLPGVTSVGEASTGFNVRGGSTDQNLILFDGATIYNPSHLLGFFSAFNTDVVKGVELYKSVIPVKFGGRLSSVLDIATKDGNDKKITGSGGIGLLTSKFTIEGPLIKNKTSFIFGARTTYSDWLLKAIPNKSYNNSSASFYDMNVHISHTINSKNNLYLTGYISKDNFRFNNDTSYNYGNKNIVAKWKHIFNNKLYNLTSAGIDNYEYQVSSVINPINAYKLYFNITQKNFKSDFTFTPNNTHSLNFGVSSIYYTLQPGSFEPYNSQSLVATNKLPSEQALESALYAGDQYNITSKLQINAGIRYSIFNYLGPHDSYNYVQGLPKETATITDTTSYASGKVIKTYQAPEYRVSVRYVLPGDASIKIGFNTLQQYIHMLSNTITISPTDIWKLSDTHIKPQQGEQISLGYYQNFKNTSIETSLEVYYKALQNILDYKSGAELLLNHHIETDIINSRGKAYGAELLIKKVAGKLNGWISYTYSRTLLRTDDALAGQPVNRGTYYPASYDKPHNVNFISNYKFSHRLSVSLNLVYNSGRPITLPIAVFYANGGQRLLYSDRNAFRIPDYFRTDLSVNLDGNHKIKQALHNSWSFGIYNLTARKNVYSAYFISENGIVKGYQLSIFGTAIPFISYNFRF